MNYIEIKTKKKIIQLPISKETAEHLSDIPIKEMAVIVGEQRRELYLEHSFIVHVNSKTVPYFKFEHHMSKNGLYRDVDYTYEYVYSLRQCRDILKSHNEKLTIYKIKKLRNSNLKPVGLNSIAIKKINEF